MKRVCKIVCKAILASITQVTGSTEIYNYTELSTSKWEKKYEWPISTRWVLAVEP